MRKLILLLLVLSLAFSMGCQSKRTEQQAQTPSAQQAAATIDEGAKKGKEVMQLLDSGNFSKAEKLVKESVDENEKNAGGNPNLLADSYNELANVYIRQGRNEEALKYYEKSLAIKEKAADKNPASLALTFHDIGNLYVLKEETMPKAEEYFLKSLKTIEEKIGKESPEALSTLNSLGELYIKKERYPDAEIYFLQALKIAKANPGYQNNYYLAYTLKNLGITYSYEKKNEEAMAMLKEAIGLSEKENRTDIQFYSEQSVVLNQLMEIQKRLKSPEYEQTKKKLMENDKILADRLEKDGRREEAASVKRSIQILEGKYLPPLGSTDASSQAAGTGTGVKTGVPAEGKVIDKSKESTKAK
ncbi:MAG: tetratricopeptide repeat protein [Chloroflexi bacterium]|nr:tetratricopeptide repeat protein [Chloroflexota bacterium]